MNIFGQGAFQQTANDTPESIARKRALIASLMPRFGQARYVGEGLGQLATGVAIGARNRKLDQAETAGQKGASDIFSRIFGGAGASNSAVNSPFGGGGSSYQPPADMPAMNDGVIGQHGGLGFGGPAMGHGTATGGNSFKAPLSEGQAAIRAGLVQRGLPEHVADGIMMNFADESGFNTAAVGDNGNAYGLAQWHGPRKRALEAFAASRGVPASDMNAQLDFLTQELQGPEAAAGKALLASTTAGEAGSAFLNQFERPAEEHRARRDAAYSGGSASGGSQPAQPDLNSLYEAMANPFMSPEQKAVIGQMIAQGQQQADPSYQMGIEKQRLELDALRNPGAPKPLEVGGVLLDPNTYQPIFDSRTPPTPEAPTTKSVKLADGSEVMVQWNPKTEVWDAAQIPEGGTTGGGKKLTEAQGKLTLFQTLQTETAPVLLDLEKQFDPANFSDPALAKIPIAGNYFTSPEYQQYKSAASVWAEGALRISTGAAATPSEIERNLQTYFAQPGDTPSTVAFKAQMRLMYDRAVNSALGKPDSGQRLPLPSEFAKQFGADGKAAATSTGPATPQSVATMDAAGLARIDINTVDEATADAMIKRFSELKAAK